MGRRLAKLLRAGDLVMLNGELGAGKTTLTRGLGEGLGVRGAVTSPTFVIARVNLSSGDGPPLVHVGEGKVEELTDNRLNVVIHRAVGDTTDEVRHVTVTGLGARWASVELGALSA